MIQIAATHSVVDAQSVEPFQSHDTHQVCLRRHYLDLHEYDHLGIMKKVFSLR